MFAAGLARHGAPWPEPGWPLLQRRGCPLVAAVGGHRESQIFYGSGSEGLRGLESEVNSWLAKFASGAQILDKHTAACTVADTADGEYFQLAVITIWYVE